MFQVDSTLTHIFFLKVTITKSIKKFSYCKKTLLSFAFFV